MRNAQTAMFLSAVHLFTQLAMYQSLPPIYRTSTDCILLTVPSAESRGVEKAHEETAPAPQAEASEEAAPAAADETNGPTPEQEAEAEAKVS